MPTDLEHFLDAHYPAGPFRLREPLTTSGHRLAWLAETPAGRWTVKLTDPGRPESQVRRDVGTPAYLAGLGFPAPEPLPALDGALYLPFGERFLYVLRYLEGGHPRPSADIYTRLGRLLAHLHSLPPGEIGETTYYPAETLAHVRRALLGVSAGAHRELIPELLEMIDRFPPPDGLPRGILHTDPYFVNLIEGPGGELALIDWEDGGLGWPIFDVGYVLGHVCTFTARDRRIWGVPGPEEGVSWRPDWGEAFLAGYQSARPLTPAETAYLPAAMRFNFLVYILTWDTNEVIYENYQRMKMVGAG